MDLALNNSVVLREAAYSELRFVAQNMRAADRKEIFATMWNDDPDMLSKNCLNTSAGMSWTMGKNVPIAAVGAFPCWPGVWSVWMFATDRFPEVGLSMTKFIKKRMIPAIWNHAHRAQCHSIYDHADAHKWLESLGAQRESVLKAYGKGGEDFYCYTWSK